MMEPAEQFITRWRSVLEMGALVHFSHAPRGEVAGSHCEIADAFVADKGMKTIGFNWELLDAGAPAGDRRSGLGELVKALAYNLANPSEPWLPEDQAHNCAQDFLSLFDSASLTLVSNRYDGLWNPIAGGEVEWGFLGFDNDRTILLLLANKG